MRTRHWKDVWCTDHECPQDAQHQHRVYDPEEPKRSERTLTIRLCDNHECLQGGNKHAHQGSGVRTDSEKIDMDQEQQRVTIRIHERTNPHQLQGHFACDKWPTCETSRKGLQYTHFRNAKEYEVIPTEIELQGTLDRLEKMGYTKPKRTEPQGLCIMETETKAQYEKHLTLCAKIDDRYVKVMVDSGATGNYIKTDTVKKLGIQPRRKTNPYGLQLADGSPTKQGEIEWETLPIRLWIEEHQELIVLDMVNIKYDIILGLPWLRKHGPQIDWRSRGMTFPNCDHGEEGTVVSFSTAIWIRPKDKILATTDSCPVEYQDEFCKLFKDEKTELALPKHQPWDHEIPLEPGKKPTFRPIYQLSENELRVLKSYLDEHLKKGFIRLSSSPAGYPVLFAPKPGGGLRLCVDYRQLNEITIKNRYLLPLISELQDKIRGAKRFTTIDLQAV